MKCSRVSIYDRIGVQGRVLHEEAASDADERGQSSKEG